MDESGIGFESWDKGLVGPAWHWLHPEPGRTIGFLVVCEAPLWFRGHFSGRRMEACEGNGCSLCASGVGIQRRWIATGIEERSGIVYAWEFGDAVAEVLKREQKKKGSCRGLLLEIGRSGESVHTRLRVECMGVQKVSEASEKKVPAPALVFEATFKLEIPTPTLPSTAG